MMDSVLTEPEKKDRSNLLLKNFMIILGMAIVMVAEHAKSYKN